MVFWVEGRAFERWLVVSNDDFGATRLNWAGQWIGFGGDHDAGVFEGWVGPKWYKNGTFVSPVENYGAGRLRGGPKGYQAEGAWRGYLWEERGGQRGARRGFRAFGWTLFQGLVEGSLTSLERVTPGV